jgi:hypothetical protein
MNLDRLPCLIIFLLLFHCTITTGASARTVHDVYGSNGINGVIPNIGGATDECPAGSYLTGLVGNVGSWIDQISVVCSKLKPDGTLGGGKSLPSRGGTGGGFKQASCGPNEAATGFDIGRDANYNLTHLKLLCINLGTSARHDVYFVNRGYFRHGWQGCGSGELASGLVVKFGQYVYGLGLICGDYRPVATPAKETSEPTRKCRFGMVLKHGICRPRTGSGTATGPTPVPDPPPALKDCKVSKTGTVYDAPGGKGREKGELPAGTKNVTLKGKSGSTWFNVNWPKGDGWVYSGPGFENALTCP